jgi:uncharacterized membrane protein YgcG
MSVTGEKPPKHERPHRPAAAPGPVRRPDDKVLASVLVVVAFFLALMSAGIASSIGGISSLGVMWLLWPLLAAAMLLIIYAVRYAERLTKKAVPGLRFGLTLAVLAFATFAVVKLDRDGQRCVDAKTMTVVAATNCQNQNAGTQGSQDVWYYGGTGARVGDTVDEGSFTPPAGEDGGGGGGSGGSGGDTGDDGGDGGGGDGGE